LGFDDFGDRKGRLGEGRQRLDKQRFHGLPISRLVDVDRGRGVLDLAVHPGLQFEHAAQLASEPGGGP
jgi:hypothetical protein